LNRSIAFVAMLTVLAIVSPASAETWTCTMKETTQSGFVAEKVTVVRIDDGTAVKVNDAMISEYRSDWLRGKVDYENDMRVTVVWRLPFVRNPSTISASPQTNLFYSMTIRKADLSARMQIRSLPHGTGKMRTYSGTGQCVVAQ
jgi:hypothetical protein